jgi:hypothetical protein
MALPVRFSLLHSDLNDFLFASVGEEQNGVTLSVVSALTRRRVDPWEEAARLAPLPKARAAETLAKLIARLPIRRTESWDDLAISRRLIELLPADKPATSPAASGQGQRRKSIGGHDMARQPCACRRNPFPACCDWVRPILRGYLLAPAPVPLSNRK